MSASIFAQDSDLELLFRADDFEEDGGNLFASGLVGLYTGDVPKLALKVSPAAPFELTQTGAQLQIILDGTFAGEVIVGSLRGVLNASDGTPDSVLVTNATGNVGIVRGTPAVPAPGKLLDVVNLDADAEMRVMGGTGNWTAKLYLVTDGDDDATDEWLFFNDVSNELSFRNNDVIRLQITAAGEVQARGDLIVVGALAFASDTSTSDQPNIYDIVHINLFEYSATIVQAGTSITWIAGHQNTGASNILLNALAQKNLFKMHNQELGSGDIEAGQIVTAVYDGTQWQMTSQLAN